MKYEYPTPDGTEIGCKVMWRYYKADADALKAAEVAKREAVYQAERGYDFGYLCPGDVALQPEGSTYAGLWKVVCP